MIFGSGACELVEHTRWLRVHGAFAYTFLQPQYNFGQVSKDSEGQQRRLATTNTDKSIALTHYEQS